MLLFTRTVTIKPERMPDALPYVLDITAKVSAITGFTVNAWSPMAGLPLATVTWSTMVESHADLGAAGEKLMADPGYVEALSANAGLFATGAEDAISEVVAMVNEDKMDGDARYVNAITAQCGEGRIADAMAWGVDILQYVGGLSGLPGAFVHSLYGPWATVGWISLAKDLAQVDASNAKVSADPGYLERIDGNVGMFTPGSGQVALSQRLN